jgi:hypothetical protein
LYPATEEVLGLHERFTLYCGTTPTPLRDSVAGEFDALLVRTRLAVSVALAVGEKMTLKLAL